MDRITTVEAQERFADVLRRAAVDKERVVLTDNGRGLVAIVPIEDLEWLEALEDRLDNEEADAALAEVAEKGTIPWEKIEARIEEEANRQTAHAVPG